MWGLTILVNHKDTLPLQASRHTIRLLMALEAAPTISARTNPGMTNYGTTRRPFLRARLRESCSHEILRQSRAPASCPSATRSKSQTLLFPAVENTRYSPGGELPNKQALASTA